MYCIILYYKRNRNNGVCVCVTKRENTKKKQKKKQKASVGLSRSGTDVVRSRDVAAAFDACAMPAAAVIFLRGRRSTRVHGAPPSTVAR